MLSTIPQGYVLGANDLGDDDRGGDSVADRSGECSSTISTSDSGKEDPSSTSAAVSPCAGGAMLSPVTLSEGSGTVGTTTGRVIWGELIEGVCSMVSSTCGLSLMRRMWSI